MNLTSVDPPEVIRFVKQNYPEVELTKPKASIYHIAVEKGLLPTQRVRWCCDEYKENAGAGKVTLIGIRHQESTRRSKRNEVEISSYKFSGTLEGFEKYREERLKKKKRGRQPKGVNITNATSERTIGCISGKESLLISPIIHWTVRDVWEFLNKVCQVPHCSLYDEGYSRIGCICCPMSQPRQKIKEMKRWPHVKSGWIKAIIDIRRGGEFVNGQNVTRCFSDWQWKYHDGRKLPHANTRNRANGAARGNIFTAEWTGRLHTASRPSMVARRVFG